MNYCLDAYVLETYVKFILANVIILELILFNLLITINKIIRCSLFKNQTLKGNSLYNQLGAY